MYSMNSVTWLVAHLNAAFFISMGQGWPLKVLRTFLCSCTCR